MLCDPGAFNSYEKEREINIDLVQRAVETYPGFLDKRAKWATPHHQQILDASSFDALLLTNLTTNLGSAPQVQQWHELGESIHDTTFTQLFSILSEDVTWAKIGDDTCKNSKVITKQDRITNSAHLV